MIGADNARIDPQRGLEWQCRAAGQIAIEILSVHEDVGTGLEFGEHAKREIDPVRAGARSGHDLGAKNPRRSARG